MCVCIHICAYIYIRVCVCVYIYFLAMPRGMWDLSSPTGIEPAPPASKAQSLTHWTAREVQLWKL